MSKEPSYLFSSTRFTQYEKEQREQMRQEISELSSTELENSTDSLALIFSSKYAPSLVQLHEPVHDDVGKVEKVVERLRGQSLPGLPRSGGKVTKDVQRLKLRVPYSGEKHLLHKRPRRTTASFPTYDELSSQEIVHYVDYQVQNREAEEIKSTIDHSISRWKGKLEDYVGYLNRDIRKMQEDFEDKARRHIEDHREDMEAKNEALEELGISTGPGAQGFVEPEKKKDLELPNLDDSSGESVELREKTFVDILDIIDSMKVNVESSKKRLRELDEESLRDIFLGAIDSHYGSATAESYNRDGKTDILLRHQSRNLFVAECKIWRGPSAFEDAVDQLLGNLSSTDSHAALMVFSDRAGYTNVCEKVEQGVKSHDDFEGVRSRFNDHDVYRFRTPSGGDVSVALKTVDLGS